jgi:1,4-dihydroxy-2-naphthoate octaprenyltransferase
MRIPFSYFLLPVFLFSLAISPNVSEKSARTFVIVHVFYPARTATTATDKDERVLAALKPSCEQGLYYLALYSWRSYDPWLRNDQLHIFFYAARVWTGLKHTVTRGFVLSIRDWMVAAGLFRTFTLVMCYIGINKFSLENIKPSVLIPGGLCSLMLWANYPMTQVYQHEEDAKRGDETFSRMLGIRGTFYFVAGVFGLVTLGFVIYFNAFFSFKYALLFLAALSPVVLYFSYWFLITLRDETKVDYGHTMWLNFISATSLNCFFYVFHAITISSYLIGPAPMSNFFRYKRGFLTGVRRVKN